MNDIKRILAFCWPFCGIFWFGWVMVKREQPPILYSDNTPYVTLYSEEEIKYVTIGFTEHGVMNRMTRYIKKITDKADRRDD